MYFILCLLVLLPLQAWGVGLSIPAAPHRKEIDEVRRYNVAYGFSQTALGEFQLQVTVRYRPRWSRVQRFKRFMFRLQDGTIVQRDPRTLMLHLDDRELVVGKHRWWYAPYWQAADDVRIACDDDKQFKTVVVENCRLILEEPQAENIVPRNPHQDLASVYPTPEPSLVCSFMTGILSSTTNGGGRATTSTFILIGLLCLKQNNPISF